MPTTLPAAPVLGSYHVTQVASLPNRWEVHCWTVDEHLGREAWVFTEAFDGETAQADAQWTADHLNAGGC